MKLCPPSALASLQPDQWFSYLRSLTADWPNNIRSWKASKQHFTIGLKDPGIKFQFSGGNIGPNQSGKVVSEQICFFFSLIIPVLQLKGEASPAITPLDSGLGSDYVSQTREKQEVITNLTLTVEALKSSIGEIRSLFL